MPFKLSRVQKLVLRDLMLRLRMRGEDLKARTDAYNEQLRALRARVVRVEHHQGKSGWFFAKSPDLRGLLVSEPTLEALERAVPQAIIDLYAACGVEVIVERLDEDFSDLFSNSTRQEVEFLPPDLLQPPSLPTLVLPAQTAFNLFDEDSASEATPAPEPTTNSTHADFTPGNDPS